MRPIRLIARKFLGLEDVEIRFDQGDLFVVVGPNGAGKSSILEALFFALYGRGIRVERGRQELLHRGFSKDTMRVELEFFLGDRFFRVIREFSLKRGGAAVLERREGEIWKPICSGEQAVNREIEKILGFDASTFRSSVFLAQGETLNFVEATPADRFRILSSLFGLDILDVVREKAREDFNRLEGEINPQEARLRILEEKNLIKEKEHLEEEISRVREILAALRREEEQSRERLQNLERLLVLSRSREEEQKKREELLIEKAMACEKAKEDQIIVEAQRVKLDFWQPWQECLRDVRKIVEGIEKGNMKLEEIKAEEKNTCSLLEINQEKKKALLEELSGFREKEKAFKGLVPAIEEIKRLKPEVSFLNQGIRDTREKLSELQRESSAVEKESERLEKEVLVLGERLKALEEEVLDLREKEKVAGPLYEQWFGYLKDLESLRREEKRLNGEGERWRKERGKIVEALKKVKEDFQEVQRKQEAFEQEYRKKSRAFMVETLRKEWAENGVCPVCGTPVPFQGIEKEEHIDFLEWETSYRKLQEAVTRFKTQMGHLEERLEEISKEEERIARERERVGLEIGERERQKSGVEAELRQILKDLKWKEEKFNVEILRGIIRTREGELEQVRRQHAEGEKELTRQKEKQASLKNREAELIAKLQEMEERCRELDGELEKQRKKVSVFLQEMRIESEISMAEVFFEEAFAAITEQLDKLGKDLNEMLVEERGIEERLRNLDERRKELEKELLLLEVERERSEKEEKARRNLFQQELECLGWSETYFLEFADKKRGNWQEYLSKIEGSLRQVEERIASLEEEEQNLVDNLKIKDETVKLQEVVEEEKKRYGCLRNEVGERENSLGRLNATLENVNAELREWQELAREIAEKKRKREILEQLLTALEARNFKNYLLAVLFQKLEEEASQLLFFLSGERYVLRMKSEGGKAQMVVVDHHFGQEERFLHECSGGEKTLIALALALAISRLWLKERGHKRTLDCLFIDEGFSPLDREHLELVADAILRLGKDGKMVGIVTHDSLFAEYFPLHLVVREGKASWKKNLESLPIS
ncbi:MAG: SMC family ATPase [Candidatus Atribacteria bacterium]|nr:SMC family ATPase [Candidatus Atribacteria bacterium]